jgi:hypothetical protein
MTETPVSLTFFASLTSISQVLTKSELPLLEAHQLHDVFLPDAKSQMPFTCDELFDLSVKFIAGAIFGKTPPKGQPNNPLQKAIMRWRMESRFNDESEVREALQGLLPSMLEMSFNEAKACHDAWLNYVSLNKVIPLFENFQDLDLWLEKAFALKGAAIKFKCPDDSIFSQCVPVNYKKVPARTVNPHSYVEHMLGNIHEVEFKPQEILTTQNYNYRRYKEWRLIVETDADSLAFSPDLIQSLYLGVMVSESNAEKLKKHMMKVNPKVNVYHARCNSNEFNLDFEKLKTDTFGFEE